jgi:hypothetical protein
MHMLIKALLRRTRVHGFDFEAGFQEQVPESLELEPM